MTTSCPVHGTKGIIPPDLTTRNLMTGEEDVKQNPLAGQCYLCRGHNERAGKGKAQPKREGKPLIAETYNAQVFKKEEFLEWWKRLTNDPVRYAAFLADTRRPKGVSKRTYGIAIRSACSENMLNGDKKSITNGLNYKEPTTKTRLVKGTLHERLIVKPLTLANAKSERTATFWGERMWTVYTLKYSRGYVIVTDKGSESKVLNSMGELFSAVRKSGWEIVR